MIPKPNQVSQAATLPIDTLTLFETELVRVLYDQLLAVDKERWTYSEIRKQFQSVGDLEFKSAITSLWQNSSVGFAENVMPNHPEDSDMVLTPQGFADYVQHFRGDIESQISEIAMAVTGQSCKTVAEIMEHTDAAALAVKQTLRFFAYENRLTLDASGTRVVSIDNSLVEIYG